MRRVHTTLVLSFLGSLLTGCGSLVHVRHQFELSADWRDYTGIAVQNMNGRVELIPHEGDAVRVEGEKYAGGSTSNEANRRLEQVRIVAGPDATDGGTLRISVEVPNDWRNGSVGARLRILVPRAVSADIGTSNGSIRVERMAGLVKARTTNGRIEAIEINGSVQASSSNGSILAQRVKGDFEANTSNGSVSAVAVAGKCDINTSNGSVRVEQAMGDVTVVTSNGRIEIDGAPPDEAAIVLRTSNASIMAALPSTMKAELDLRTINGRVKIEDVTLTATHESRTHVEGKMNGGGSGRVVLISSNGNVTLRRRG